MNKISVVLATFNEERNLEPCLNCVSDLASEIVIVDGGSSDQTVEIAKKYRARVVVTNNPPIFHINKQKAIDLAENSWILQLDADERVTKRLSDEILKVVQMSDAKLDQYQLDLPDRELFLKHQAIIEERDGQVGDPTGRINAFFIPRRNYFLGKYLKYGGTYPDPAIRLIRKGKAHLPCKDVHEQMVVKGRVGWLQNYMQHLDSPTFSRYLQRNSRYIDLMVRQLERDQMPFNIATALNYLVVKPISWFFWTLIRHKGVLDGFQGVVFSFFSALRFPRAFVRYYFRS